MATEDSYWEESKVKGFNFSDNESSDKKMCGVSLEESAKLSLQIKAGLSPQKDLFDSFCVSDGKEELQPELEQLIPEKILDCILDSDNVEFSFNKVPLMPETEELRILRRQVDSRWSPPEIGSVLRKILTGQPYSLELYRSLGSKKDLLKAAIANGDGDAILMVVLFLSQTLKKSLFHQILSTSPVAVQHYVSYLTTRMQIQEVTDLLEMLGRNKEASMKQFTLACMNPQRQLQRLKGCLRNHFADSKDKFIVENFIKLIEWEESVGKKPTGESAVACLDYALSQGWDSKGPSSPFHLSQEQGLSDRVFQWRALDARAAAGAWTDLEPLFFTKGWLGQKRLKTELPMDLVVLELSRLQAPPAVLTRFLELVEPLEKRLDTAKRVHCHRTVIDVYIAQKDRQNIMTYKANLQPQSEDYFYAEQALRTPNTKWKN